MLISHVYIFFGECLLKSFAHFYIGLFIFLMLNFKFALYILVTSPLPDNCFANISPSLWLVFHSLNSAFYRADGLNFNEVQFTN